MIEFRHVDKIYSKRSVALNDVSFRVDEGEFVFITGHSGAGKSTLLKILAGIEKPSKGQVLLKGTVISQLSVSAVPYLRRGIGIILQENTLLNDRTVLENTILPLLVTGVSMKNATARGLLALQKVGLTGKENRYPLELSGGNQQRVAIARAIINRPSILIADEPTSSLDKLSAQKIIEVLLEFYRAGVTTIVATHDESLVAQYATRVLEINQGNVLSRKI